MKKLIFTIAMLTALSANAQSLTPENGAKNVCADTHLTLRFDNPVSAGKSGKVRVYERPANGSVADEVLVDSLDLSIPAGPTQSREYGPECDYTKIPYDYTRSSVPTNRDTKPGTPSGMAEPTPPEYQLNIIGGFTDAFHFHPVIACGNTATIYLHNNILQYGRTYRITVDKSVLNADGFEGISDWSFEVKKDMPTGVELNVKADGTGDLCTLQGALDHIPDFSDTHYYIYVGEGDFEELVYVRNKSNVTIKGAGMDKTKVHYANNEVFNPHPLLVKTNERPGTFPSRRAAVDFDNCRDVALRDITFATDLTGQAEGLLLNGEHFDLKNVRIIGSGDALQANGTIYMEDSEIIGGTDAILSRGAVFAKHCNFVNDGGPFAWIRNTKSSHGLVFVECTLGTTNGRPFDFARCPTNKKTTYPDAEMVLINCKAHDVIPSGWSALGEPTVQMLELNTTSTLTGEPFDTANRHKYSRQLDAKKDKKVIRKYSNPKWVLNGWSPKR